MNKEGITTLDIRFEPWSKEIIDEAKRLYEENKQLKADKIEMAKAIVEVSEIQKRTYGSGMDLHLDMITYADENKELFEKSNKYIKEVGK